MSDENRTVRIELDQWGNGRVVIGGIDVSDKVSGFRIDHHVGSLPVVRLDFPATAVDLTADVAEIVESSK